MFKFVMSASFAAVSLAPSATAHLHVNMEAASSAEGTALEIAFYGNESPFAIVAGESGLEFHQDGSLLTLTADTRVGHQYDSLMPGLEGYQRASMLNFTTDGGTQEVANLTAPNDRPSDPNAQPLGYQIVSVNEASTGEALGEGFRVLWQLFGQGHGGGELTLPADYHGYPTFSADSSADTLAGQSYLLPVGAHGHGGTSPDSGFFLLTNAPRGEYDIAVRAVDMAGYFASSEPVSFRLNVVPEPASLSLLGIGGLLVLRRRR